MTSPETRDAVFGEKRNAQAHRLSVLVSVNLTKTVRVFVLLGSATLPFVALKAQYEQPLFNGTCATTADVARHVGVSRVCVSRVSRGIKSKAG